jgi:hypothetical protein
MWMGRERMEWDRNAALQQTLLVTGLSRPKRMPKMDDLNPIRRAEQDEEEWLDDFDKLGNDIEKALR